MTTRRSRIVGNSQSMRLGVLRSIRQSRSVDAPRDFVPADVPELLVIEAGENYLRTCRLARLAAGDDPWWAFRRVAVVGMVNDAILHDFTHAEHAAVDEIYRLLLRPKKGEPE